MFQEKLVSVIIPLYNCEDRILRCVSSVLNQTYKNIEVIVIDDGSTDNSLEVLRNGISDPRLQIYSQQNHGVSYTRNRGIDIALSNDTDGWITFVDSDDYIMPNAFEVCLQDPEVNYVEYIHYGRMRKKKNKEGVCTNIEKNKAFNRYESYYQIMLLGIYRENLIKDNWIVFVTSGFFKKSILCLNNISFDVNINNGEDTLFVMHYLEFCNNVMLINSPMYVWCERENSLSSVFNKDHISRLIKECIALWPAMLDCIKKNEWELKLGEIYSRWVISYYNMFLNRSAKLNLNYKEIKKYYRDILAQNEVLKFVRQQRVPMLHERIARFMLMSKSSVISFLVIKGMRLINGYWKIKSL